MLQHESARHNSTSLSLNCLIGHPRNLRSAPTKLWSCFLREWENLFFERTQHRTTRQIPELQHYGTLDTNQNVLCGLEMGCVFWKMPTTGIKSLATTYQLYRGYYALLLTCRDESKCQCRHTQCL